MRAGGRWVASLRLIPLDAAAERNTNAAALQRGWRRRAKTPDLFIARGQQQIGRREANILFEGLAQVRWLECL